MIVIELLRIRFRDDFLFDRLILSLQNDFKRQQICELKYHQFRPENEYMVFDLCIKSDIASNKKNLQLILHPKLYNLKTEQTYHSLKFQNNQLIVDTQLATFEIVYNIKEKNENLTVSTIKQTKQKNLKQHKTNNKISNFNTQEDQIISMQNASKNCHIMNHPTLKSQEEQQCEACSNFQNKNITSQIIYNNQDNLHKLKKQNAKLRQQIGLIKKNQIKQTQILYEQINTIQKHSNRIILENLNKKKQELSLRNDWELQKMGLMQKVLHLRQLLQKIQNT